jgi:hypothetical protein
MGILIKMPIRICPYSIASFGAARPRRSAAKPPGGDPPLIALSERIRIGMDYFLHLPIRINNCMNA